MESKQQQGGGASNGQHEQYKPIGQQPGAGGNISRREDTSPGFSRWRGARTPFELMARMDEDMDRLFRRFWGSARSPWRGRTTEMAQVWAPQVEMFERDGQLHVHVDLPGMTKEEVKLSIDDDQLVIQGERHASHASDSETTGYFHSERSYGSFYRAVPLPEGLDAETAEASFDGGVLKVQFAAPQQRQGKTREVPIR